MIDTQKLKQRIYNRPLVVLFASGMQRKLTILHLTRTKRRFVIGYATQTWSTKDKLPTRMSVHAFFGNEVSAIEGGASAIPAQADSVLGRNMISLVAARSAWNIDKTATVHHHVDILINAVTCLKRTHKTDHPDDIWRELTAIALEKML